MIKKAVFCLCFISLALQASLPFVHEWRETQKELAYHSSGTPVSAPAFQPDASESGHEHHDAHACETCVALANFQHALIAPPYTIQSLNHHFSDILLKNFDSVPDFYFDSFPPRGPPLA